MFSKSNISISSFFDENSAAQSFFTFAAVLFLVCLLTQNVSAHQQPTTIVQLDINPEQVEMKLEIPLSELELAFGHDVSQNTETLVERLAPELQNYLKTHIRPVTANQPWTVEVKNVKVENAEQTQRGAFQEIAVLLDLVPPAGVGTRRFTLNYDVILHQVVTQRALVDRGIRRARRSSDFCGKINVRRRRFRLDFTDWLSRRLNCRLRRGERRSGGRRLRRRQQRRHRDFPPFKRRIVDFEKLDFDDARLPVRAFNRRSRAGRLHRRR